MSVATPVPPDLEEVTVGKLEWKEMAVLADCGSTVSLPQSFQKRMTTWTCGLDPSHSSEGSWKWGAWCSLSLGRLPCGRCWDDCPGGDRKGKKGNRRGLWTAGNGGMKSGGFVQFGNRALCEQKTGCRRLFYWWNGAECVWGAMKRRNGGIEAYWSQGVGCGFSCWVDYLHGRWNYPGQRREIILESSMDVGK